MIFNLLIVPKQFDEVVNQIQDLKQVKLLEKMDFIHVVSIETSKKNMLNLVKKINGIKQVEVDGKVIAI